MSARRIGSTVLLVALSGVGGALLVEVLRDAGPPPAQEVVREQEAQIQGLEAEVRRLLGERASSPPTDAAPAPVAPPVLTGSPAARREPVPVAVPPPEVPAPSRESAAAATPELPNQPGGMLDLIRALATSEARQASTTLVDDSVRLASLFARQAKGPTVRAEETHAKAKVKDGTTIVLDAGVYDFSAFSSAHRGAFPADVTFRGVGMDRTLLILNEVSATGETRNLGFEDLTLDTRGQYLADVRGDEPISLRFDRARVIGFDQAPGGAVMLAARHGAVLARDTRFEAGFGNAPGTGSFFHVRGPFLVRFEGCTIVGPFKSLYEKSDRAAYAYVRCRFENMPPDRRRDLETTDPNVHLEDCQIVYDPTANETPSPRSRSELNPAWM